MKASVLKVLDPGSGATVQDRGRTGWRRFGVPAGGVMDEHAAGWANRLLENPIDAPVVELFLDGARLEVLENTWIAITGAEAEISVPVWRAVRVKTGDVIRFGPNHSGLYNYMAVEDGFDVVRVLGSAGAYPQGALGQRLMKGDVLHRRSGRPFVLPEGVGGRVVSWREIRRYESPPVLVVWPGPEWEEFGKKDRSLFLEQSWEVTAQSDRVGYNFKGEPLKLPKGTGIYEPLRVGTIQILADGQPSVTMRDGPGLGRHPKLGVVDAADLAWLAQCRPGQNVQFRPADNGGS